MGTILGARSNCPPILHLTSSRRSKQREKGGNRSGAECAQATLHTGARDGQRGEPVGRGGAPTARRPATEGGETARRSRTRRGAAARRRRQQAARSGRHPSGYSGGRRRRSWTCEGGAACGRRTRPSGAAAWRPPISSAAGGEGAGGVDGGTLPNAPAGATRTAVLAADPGDDRRGESLCCWLTTTAARIRGIRGAS